MKEEEKATEFFEAPYVVHWPTGPVECCEKHMKGLMTINKALGGMHIAITNNTEPLEKQCQNCINESKA